ncbi:MAG TPA: adenylate/guanylate cyclase domain-containing protein [Arcobacter sp.]|nr:adenylate/guanylate cyclase domain-containing protein [Arcobacter sp.]
MQVEFSKYDYKKSRNRMDSILNNDSEEIILKENKFPLESLLTFTNIITSTVDIIAIDIRKSTELSEALAKNRIKKLTKIYRVYISEVTAVMKGNLNIERIYIEGDGVWAVFKSVKNTNNIPRVFDTASQISAIVETMNVKLRDMNYPFIEVGIGIETGKTYYAKAGYKGVGINAEVWVGNIVNKAFKLCSFANKNKIKEIVVSENVYVKLDEKQQKNLKKYKKENIFHGAVISEQMYKEWLKHNSSSYLSCKSKKTNYCYIPTVENHRKRKWWKLWLGY